MVMGMQHMLIVGGTASAIQSQAQLIESHRVVGIGAPHVVQVVISAHVPVMLLSDTVCVDV